MKFLKLLLPVFLIICLVALPSSADIAQILQYSARLDCDGIPLTIDAQVLRYEALQGIEYRCPQYKKSELIRLRDSIPFASLGIDHLPSSGWEADSGALFTPHPDQSIFRFYITSCSVSIDRAEGYFERDSLLYQLRSGFSSLSAGINLLSGPGDSRFDSAQLNLGQAVSKAEEYAAALALELSGPVEAAYCHQEGILPFYWVRFAACFDGLPFHFLPVNGGFPGEGSDVRLPFYIAWGEEGLISLFFPLTSSLEAKGQSGPLIAADEAAEAVRNAFANQWLPGVKGIVIDKMGLSRFSYSSIGSSTGGFTLYPVWYFEGIYEFDAQDEPQKPFSMFINALTGKQVY